MLWTVISSILTLGVLVCAVVWGGGPSRRRGRAASAWSAPLPEEAVRGVWERLAQGKKIHAIKELRDATGMSLKDAKDIVDALADGEEVPVIGAVSLADRVRQLRAEGKMIEAIRAVVEQTGMTETEASRFVETLD